MGENVEAGQGTAEQAWLAEAEGEQRVGEQLSRLEAEEWTVLHDVHWPSWPKANLDHLLVGTGGVLVINAKNWSGDVRLRDGGRWRRPSTRAPRWPHSSNRSTAH